MAELLRDGKEEKARITTEHIVREDFVIEAYDILELMISVVIERLRLIDAEKECPFDMREAVCTLIYAANRTEVKELVQVKEQLIKKYGKEFGERAMANHNGCVNERIVQKLSAMPPNAFLVLNYMKELAQQYNIDWQPDETTAAVGSRFDVAMAPPTGASVEAGVGSGLGASAYRYTDGRILPPGQTPANFDANDIPSAPLGSPGVAKPGVGGGAAGPGAGAGAGARPGAGGPGAGGPGAGAGGLGAGAGAGAGTSKPGASGTVGSYGVAAGGTSTGVGAAKPAPGDGFNFDDIPMPPSGRPGAGGGAGTGGHAAPAATKPGADAAQQFKDDPSTYGKDDEAVPDFDELSRRFNALKGK